MLLDLARRCEAATGPDRVLDAEVFCAVEGVACRFALTPEGNVADIVPAYSDSMDAAMTLVPEGWRVRDVSQGDRWHFSLWFKSSSIVDGHGETFALALCAAALRSRQALSQGGE